MGLPALADNGPARPTTSVTANLTPGVLYDALVANTAASVSSDLYVTIDAVDGGITQIGPCLGWLPSRDDLDAPVLPTSGDVAAVQASNDGNVWTMAWQPQ